MDSLRINQMDPSNHQLFVRFHSLPKQNADRTKELGRPSYDEVDFIEIRTPGDKLAAVFRELRESDLERFGEHYKKWKAGQTGEGLQGTPLSQWPLMSRSMVEEMRYFNCVTVEQLASMPESTLSKFAGLREYQKKAQDWLRAAEEGAAAGKLRDELSKRDAELADLRKAVEALQAQKAPEPPPQPLFPAEPAANQKVKK